MKQKQAARKSKRKRGEAEDEPASEDERTDSDSEIGETGVDHALFLSSAAGAIVSVMPGLQANRECSLCRVPVNAGNTHGGLA